ncbi:hypothetical protein FB563_7110 [Streptomyces puniciscabiei]|uniref:Uncharacterized protein n=1 Tax=Streptomyces puniciscabiei TaxID=164348 RepID=A0A542TJE8_9ACTN|nr:hypothetical protein [Streptomyces puniciscabiei]TQK86946.1 hypothetical protein FB563_7110 [Streptomyces puniciscabiei]
MSTETDWVYRVDEPHGSEGWRPYGDDPERWRGTVTSDDPKEDAEYVAALVVTDLVSEWYRQGTAQKHVRVIVWEDAEGTGPEDAAFTVEIQPHVGGE